MATQAGSSGEGRIILQGAPALQQMGWDTILQEWSTLLDAYDHPAVTPRDVAYWYGASALSGLLAAATWRLRGEGARDLWALEEFGEGIHHSKRGDMWLGMESKSWTIKATRDWVPWIEPPVQTWTRSTRDQTIDDIHAALDRAFWEIRRLPSDYRDGVRMAVFYAVPGLSKRLPLERDHFIDQIFTEIPKALADDHTITAAYRCRDDRELPVWPEEKAVDYIYPGVIFVGRVEGNQ